MPESAQAYENPLFCQALSGESTPRPPIWLMRQAGRTDPEYNALRERIGMPLEEMFRQPDIAAEVTLMPWRLGVDALIIFQDILTPLAPMGVPFVFAPGPITPEPLRGPDDVARVHGLDPAEALPHVEQAYLLARHAIGNALPLLGFAGAPLTLAVFMIEGGSFGEDAPHTKAMMAEDPKTLRTLLERLADATAEYLKFQAACGAEAVQLFESAAHLFSPEEYREFALPYQQQIAGALQGAAPLILFAREWTRLEDLAAVGADAVSLPSTAPIARAREAIPGAKAFQGNLSNRLLADGPLEAILEAADACVADGARRGHIFNLDHGLLRETPYEHVQALVQHVRDSAAA